jgi:hypothetical protein
MTVAAVVVLVVIDIVVVIVVVDFHIIGRKQLLRNTNWKRRERLKERNGKRMIN